MSAVDIYHWPQQLEYVRRYVARGAVRKKRKTPASTVPLSARNVELILAFDEQKALEQPVVLELDGLSDHDKVFFTEALLLWIYEARKRESRREVFKHALLIEEGHHILSSRKERHEGAETIMETLLRQSREFGEAVLVLDQEPERRAHRYPGRPDQAAKES